MKEVLLQAVAPAAQEIAMVLVVALVGTMTELFRRFTGISIEAKHREALQSALQNGARLLINSAFTKENAIDYVIASVPDALKALKVDKADRNRIGALLQPHLLTQKAANHTIVNMVSSEGGATEPAARR